MRNRGLVCFSLILGCTFALVQSSFADRYSNKALRNLLAATASPAPVSFEPTQDPAPVAMEWNGAPSRLAFIDTALRNVDVSNGTSYFLQGSRTHGGMAISVGRPSYPGHGYTLDLRWQLGQ
jgi:hypothetical protein